MKRLLNYLLTLLCVVLLFLSSTVEASSKEEYQKMGLLPYKGKPYFKLGKLDKLGRPTWAHIQFHDFMYAEAAKPYKNPKKGFRETGYMTDYLPGFQGNDAYYLIPRELDLGYMAKAWSPRHLLSLLWTDGSSANTARNYGLITNYADTGYSRYKFKALSSLQDYERALDDWTSSSSSDWTSKTGYKRYMVDYKIELIYQGEELVPRHIKLRYVGLTEQGKLRKINLDGEATFDRYGIATVIIDNKAPNLTIDYLTGAVTGQIYVPVEEENINAFIDEPSDEDVYVDVDNGYYYYYYDIDNLDDYLVMTEKEALEDGYVWDSSR